MKKKTKKKTPSARSKKLDQLYVSKAEVHKDKEILEDLKDSLDSVELEFKDSLTLSNMAGILTEQFIKRFNKTAKRDKLTPTQLAYRLVGK